MGTTKLAIFLSAFFLSATSFAFSINHNEKDTKKKLSYCVKSMKKLKKIKFPTESLHKQLKELNAQNGSFGGSIFRIASSNKVLWEGAEGYLDSSKKAPINIRSTFEIASITKTFTAVLILQLVEEKKLSLNSRLDSLLAPSIIEHLLVINNNDYSGKITLQQLLNHTSGLAHFWDDPPYVRKGYNTFFSKFVKDENRMWHPIETLSFVPHLRPRALPGADFHYSDTNYVLLGVIIESIEKKALHEVFRKRIFNRIALKDTYLSYREKPKSRYKESHRFFEDEDLHGKEQWSADWASGGLVSSTRDLEKFIVSLANGKLFKSPNTLKKMLKWVDAGDDLYYGLGVYGIKLDNRRGMLWGHDGWGGAFMYYWPERGIVFTGTRNQTGSEEDETENEWWSLIDEGIKVIDSCGR